MSTTWSGVPEPPPRAIGPRDWPRMAARALPLLALLAICFPLLLFLRGPERLIWGAARPMTPHITQFVCIWACRALALSRHVTGVPMSGPGAFVCNHISWLDIFVLNANKRMYFVAKSEVRDWGGIGWLARANGTLFIRRDRADATAQTQALRSRLALGHQLLFFPEGTSSDGLRVLPFKTTLFQAFFDLSQGGDVAIQPVSLRYTAPPGAAPSHYGWWGTMTFGSALLQLLATPGWGAVEVAYHPPLKVSDFRGRKDLAAAAEAAVRRGHGRRD